MSRAGTRRWLAMAASVLLLPAAGSAQEVQGSAHGPDGEPLPDVVVALHRIGDMGGANVASTTTDAEGRFEFQVEVPDSALYFVAMRYADRMYIGPPAMAGVERVSDYRLAVDPAAEAGAVASGLSGEMGRGAQAPAAQPGRSAQTRSLAGGDAGLWIVALLALTAAALFILTAPRHRRRRTREAVLELATVEDRLAQEPQDDEREQLLGRRQQLRGRLAPRD